MEQNEIVDQGFSNSNSVTNSLSGEARGYLELTGYWSRFLGIFGFFMSGILAIVSLMLMFGLGAMTKAFSSGPFGGESLMGGGLFAFLGILYLGFAYLTFYISKNAYQFGKKMKSALMSGSDEDLTEGFKGLKSVFRTQGILTAILLGFYGVLLILGILGVAYAAAKQS